MWKTKTFTVRDSKPLQLWTLPGVSKAVLLVLSVAQRALTAYGVRPRQRDVLFQQHGQDLIVVPVGCHDDRCHVHGGGVLWVLNTLHQFLQRVHRNMNLHHTFDVIFRVYLIWKAARGEDWQQSRAWTISWACGWGGCPRLQPPLSLWPPTRHLWPAGGQTWVEAKTHGNNHIFYWFAVIQYWQERLSGTMWSVVSRSFTAFLYGQLNRWIILGWEWVFMDSL